MFSISHSRHSVLASLTLLACEARALRASKTYATLYREKKKTVLQSRGGQTQKIYSRRENGAGFGDKAYFHTFQGFQAELSTPINSGMYALTKEMSGMWLTHFAKTELPIPELCNDRGYYMPARGYEFYLRVSIVDISLVRARCAHSWDIDLNTRRLKLVSTSGHVIYILHVQFVFWTSTCAPRR